MPGQSAPPLAYFLSWLCYGQRLHGDARGTVDRYHNIRGTPYLAPDPVRESRARALLRSPVFSLTTPMRRIADRAIHDLASERRWRLLAADARTTHVHVVVDCPCRTDPDDVMTALKGRITTELGKAGLVGEDPDVWAEHGSTRWINHAAGLFGAIAYVNDWQSGKNREWLEEQKRLTRAFLEEKRLERKQREEKWKKERSMRAEEDRTRGEQGGGG